MDKSKIIIKEKLGQGYYSSIYKVVDKEDGTIYAMKKINMQQLSEYEQQNALNEIKILTKLKTDEFVQYTSHFYDHKNQCLCILLEYIEGQDLQQVIQKQKKNKELLKEEFIWSVIIQVLRGLVYMHSIHIIHRDLKSANLMKSNITNQVKICDFNSSKSCQFRKLNTIIGTPYYTSPEVWNEKLYDQKIDMWSFGCIIYELCALRPPFTSDTRQELIKHVKIGKYQPVPEPYSQDIRQVIDLLIQVEPSNRIGSAELLEHPILKRHIKQYDSQILQRMREAQKQDIKKSLSEKRISITRKQQYAYIK